MKRKVCISVICIFLIVGVPIVIQFVSLIHTSNGFLIEKWTAGELLNYYGTILTFLGTIILGIIAVRQNDQIKEISDESNKLNLRMLKLEECARKSYVSLKDISLSSNNVVTAKFENLNSNLISTLKIKNSDSIFRSTKWNCKDPLLKGIKEIVINDIEDKLLVSPFYNGKDICIFIKDERIEPDTLVNICLILESTNIFGYQTIQKFSITFFYSGKREIKELESHTIEI